MQAIDEILMYLAKIEELKKTFAITEEQIYCAKYKLKEKLNKTVIASEAKQSTTK